MSKNKLTTYLVPVTVVIDGHITVKARNKEKALEKAQKKYNGVDSLECICRDVDFGDESDIEEDEE